MASSTPSTAETINGTYGDGKWEFLGVAQQQCRLLCHPNRDPEMELAVHLTKHLFLGKRLPRVMHK